jgi:ectoine hydroxylase-related dioxygenase (phytanoyl-CoA dioxygenase family)
MHKLVRPITIDEVNAYETSGVVHLRGVLNLQAVNALRRSIDLAVETLKESPSGYDFAALADAYEKFDEATVEAASGGQHDLTAIMKHMRQSGQPLLIDDVKNEKQGSYFVDTAVSSRIKEFRQFVMRGAAPEIAAALMRSSTIRFYDDQVFVKEPGSRQRAAFHVDSAYFNIQGNQCCTMWIPTDPVSVRNGGMVYLRGSHRAGKTYAANVFLSQAPLPGSVGEDLSDLEKNPQNYDLVAFDVEPGDVLVHHHLTIHGTGGNHSRYQVRRAASIRYIGDDIKFHNKPGTPPRLHHTHNLQEGDEMTADDFPVCWSRTQKDAA